MPLAELDVASQVSVGGTSKSDGLAVAGSRRGCRACPFHPMIGPIQPI
jgi:hypothetical protein